MGDAIRVTVVATGLGQPVVKQQQPPIRIVQPVPVARPVIEQRTGTDPMPVGGYTGLDQPAYLRRGSGGAEAAESSGESNYDLLDVPAFLRRQAD
jgi:cell division protein FtsZ